MRRNRLTRLLTFLLAACLLLISTARGQSPTAGNENPCLSDEKCKQLLDSARILAQSNQYEGALIAYQTAYSRQPEPWLLVNIGRMQQKLGRLEESIKNFRSYLATPEQPGTERMRRNASEFLTQAEADLAARPAATPSVAPALLPSNKPTAAAARPVHKRWWFWTLVGIGVAGLVTGTALGIYSRAPDYSDVAQARPFAIQSSF